MITASYSGLQRRSLIVLRSTINLVIYKCSTSSQLSTSNHWSWYYTVYAYVCSCLIRFRDAWSFEWKGICSGLFYIVCRYCYCRWRSNYQEDRVEIPLAGLTMSHFLACSKLGHGFPLPNFVVFFFLYVWGVCVYSTVWEMIVRFVVIDVGLPTTNHRYDFLFMVVMYYWRLRLNMHGNMIY